ncbi:hypothetical protein BDF21DRAFT_394572 [Thamnidium elegans]|nr:hypothetical protein BDF21DRAFT_394572 [Thamnidium elegans]
MARALQFRRKNDAVSIIFCDSCIFVYFTKKDEQNIVKKFEITKENYKCFERTEDIELDEQVRYSEDLLFSGTNNGLVTMTETAKLDIKQVYFGSCCSHFFKKKIEIEDDQDTELNFSNDDINQATLCKTFKVHSSDLQFRSGVKTSLMKSEKLKKQTEAGKVVMNIERSFIDMNIEKAKNINEVDDMMNIKYKHRDDLRKFIIQTRKSNKAKQNKHPTMLTRDRGYCHGSSIKGHLKYGGGPRRCVHRVSWIEYPMLRKNNYVYSRY